MTENNALALKQYLLYQLKGRFPHGSGVFRIRSAPLDPGTGLSRCINVLFGHPVDNSINITGPPILQGLFVLLESAYQFPLCASHGAYVFKPCLWPILIHKLQFFVRIFREPNAKGFHTLLRKG